MIRLVLWFWPGAERFRRDGGLLSLVQAVAFSLLLNVSFLSVFIWPDAFSPVSRTVVCLAVVVFWGASRLGPTRRHLPIAAPAEPEQISTTYLFQAAQREYLIGNWLQSAQLLQELLQIDPHDIPARLRLAILFRREGRGVESARELEILLGLTGAEEWHWEIRKQQERLAASSNRNAA